MTPSPTTGTASAERELLVQLRYEGSFVTSSIRWISPVRHARPLMPSVDGYVRPIHPPGPPSIAATRRPPVAASGTTKAATDDGTTPIAAVRMPSNVSWAAAPATRAAVAPERASASRARWVRSSRTFRRWPIEIATMTTRSAVGISSCTMMMSLPATSYVFRTTATATSSNAATARAARARKTQAAKPTGMIANGSVSGPKSP